MSFEYQFSKPQILYNTDDSSILNWYCMGMISRIFVCYLNNILYNTDDSLQEEPLSGGISL
jgi:hypothetical protein